MSELVVPIWEKEFLTVKEAAAYFGIGEHKIREITDDDSCSCILWVGNKRLIKRRLFTEMLEKEFSI